jgi:CheY-like chemotaxis protein
VLVVDDEPDLCEIFQQWLIGAGCKEVLTAGDGEAALKMAREHTFDLLITDVHMPLLDGVNLIRKLHELNGRLPSAIFISGFGNVDKREMYAHGVEAFLVKPIRRDDLAAFAATALAERSALWLQPMEGVVRQTMEVEVERIGPHGDAAALQLGRGGFSLPYTGSLSLGKVAFRCRVALAPVDLAGQGYLRWRSKTDNRVGVEFAYLQPECRAWVLEAMAKAAPRSFIPS